VTWDFAKRIDRTKGSAKWSVTCETVLVIFPWLENMRKRLILGTRTHFAITEEIIRNVGKTELGESYAVDLFEPSDLC
jgi:hypothetical protein